MGFYELYSQHLNHNGLQGKLLLRVQDAVKHSHVLHPAPYRLKMYQPDPAITLVYLLNLTYKRKLLPARSMSQQEHQKARYHLAQPKPTIQRFPL